MQFASPWQPWEEQVGYLHYVVAGGSCWLVLLDEALRLLHHQSRSMDILLSSLSNLQFGASEKQSRARNRSPLSLPIPSNGNTITSEYLSQRNVICDACTACPKKEFLNRLLLICLRRPKYTSSLLSSLQKALPKSA